MAAVKWGLVALGSAAGALITTVLSLLFWAVLAGVGVEEAPLAGLAAALVVGFTSAGFAAGRLAPYFHRFHGSLAGFGLSALVVVVAIAGGSPAPTPQVLLAAAFGIVLGGIGGVVGGRRRPDGG